MSADNNTQSVPVLCDRIKSDIAIAGLNRIADRKRPSIQRVVWVILVTASAILVSIVLYGRVSFYLTSPMVIDMTVYNKQRLQFPMVTVCVNFKQGYIPKPVKHSPFEQKIFYQVIAYNGKRYFKADKNFTAEEMYGYDYNNFFDKLTEPLKPLACSYVTSLSSGAEHPCGTADFSPNKLTDLYLTSLSMPCYSMKNASWYFDQGDSVFLLVFNGSTDINYFISFQQKDDVAKVYGEAEKIDSRSYDKVIFRLTRRDLVLESTNCYTPGGRYLKYFYQYSYEKCYTECFMNYTLRQDKCGCIIPTGIERFETKEVCLPQHWIGCFQKYMHEFKHRPIEDMCDCKPRCSQQFYDIQVERSKTRKHTDNKIRIFAKFKNTRVEQIHQKTFLTFYKLFAEIGGILSLGLGIRLLTAFEIADVIIWILSRTNPKNVLCPRRRRKDEYEDTEAGQTTAGLSPKYWALNSIENASLNNTSHKEPFLERYWLNENGNKNLPKLKYNGKEIKLQASAV